MNTIQGVVWYKFATIIDFASERQLLAQSRRSSERHILSISSQLSDIQIYTGK